ncbi:hypothetical protein LTR97_012794 [Elasticomyces elasticus]|uniref:Uncharacterized protein n=1 Tax=Elasticomyces elasticus TaxID=574655 RepID=A0AAN7ZQA7_9PEZI|nr:hypothetical protein LTR97_012794 [Elasticomyces elasticus]
MEAVLKDLVQPLIQEQINALRASLTDEITQLKTSLSAEVKTVKESVETIQLAQEWLRREVTGVKLAHSQFQNTIRLLRDWGDGVTDKAAAAETSAAAAAQAVAATTTALQAAQEKHARLDESVTVLVERVEGLTTKVEALEEESQIPLRPTLALTPDGKAFTLEMRQAGRRSQSIGSQHSHQRQPTPQRHGIKSEHTERALPVQQPFSKQGLTAPVRPSLEANEADELYESTPVHLRRRQSDTTGDIQKNATLTPYLEQPSALSLRNRRLESVCSSVTMFGGDGNPRLHRTLIRPPVPAFTDTQAIVPRQEATIRESIEPADGENDATTSDLNVVAPASSPPRGMNTHDVKEPSGEHEEPYDDDDEEPISPHDKAKRRAPKQPPTETESVVSSQIGARKLKRRKTSNQDTTANTERTQREPSVPESECIVVAHPQRDAALREAQQQKDDIESVEAFGLAGELLDTVGNIVERSDASVNSIAATATNKQPLAQRTGNNTQQRTASHPKLADILSQWGVRPERVEKGKENHTPSTERETQVTEGSPAGGKEPTNPNTKQSQVPIPSAPAVQKATPTDISAITTRRTARATTKRKLPNDEVTPDEAIRAGIMEATTSRPAKTTKTTTKCDACKKSKSRKKCTHAIDAEDEGATDALDGEMHLS